MSPRRRARRGDPASGEGGPSAASARRPPEAVIRRLELEVHRRVTGTRSGDHDGLALGPGSDREELVAYQPGDDVRRIDWNATARSGGDPVVWRTRAELAVESWILVDRTASMAFGTAAREKADVAAWVAGALGLLGGTAADRVGLALLGTGGVRWTPPASGRATAATLFRTPDGPRDGRGTVTLADAIRLLTARAPRPGLRVVLSDLLDPGGAVDRPFDWEPALRALAARHEVLVVEVVDPRELELPDVGELVLVDPETGAQRSVPTADRRLRETFAAGAARYRDATAAAVGACGADHLVLRTDDDLVRSLGRWLRRRRRRPSAVRPSGSAR